VSRAGWVIVCTKTRRTLEGSFYKQANLASSYQGELLRLVAIHTLILATATYYNLSRLTGTIYCDSKLALNKSRRKALRARESTSKLISSALYGKSIARCQHQLSLTCR
jgi:hypothetical protein